MARRSLQASVVGIEKARKAVTCRNWTQQYLATEVGLGTRQSVWKFFSGRPVERQIFTEICFQLELDWQEIASPLAESFPKKKKQKPDKDCDIHALVQKVRSHRYDKIQALCGSTRLLDIAQLIKIDDIYTEINILEVPTHQSCVDISNVQAFSPEEFNSFTWNQISQGKLPGLKTVTTYPKLMVLGKPGSGKTTFLQHLAVQCNQGKLLSEQIPIFIRLKNFVEDTSEISDVSLSSYIRQKLCSRNASDSVSDCEAETLLYSGKALILLDGLDEVPEKSSDELIRQIRKLSEDYYKNQLIITCRTAAQQHQFQGFTEVEISDFDQAQIEAFAQKWFVVLNKNSREKGLAKAAQFIQQLQLSEAQQIREMVVTPLLLHLACSMFQTEASSPIKRSDFYKQALDILLFRLDKARGIKRHVADCCLSLPHKIKLLSQIAAITFEQGNYFFEKSKLQQYITDYICTLPDSSLEPETLQYESEKVLEAIEAQHGLLVERARGIYSFSHLPIQEYLMARNIVTSSNPQVLDKKLTQLVVHMSEPRWREVFLLTASMLENADALLRLVQQHVGRLVADDKLQQLLAWHHATPMKCGVLQQIASGVPSPAVHLAASRQNQFPQR